MLLPSNRRYNIKIYLRRSDDGPKIQFSMEVSDYDNFSSSWWKVLLYIVIGLVYVALGILVYKKCTGKKKVPPADTYTQVY